MAQTKRKRTRKHRGNAAGIVERPAHNSRATTASKAPTKEGGRRKREHRFNRPPTWRGATQRAAIAAGLFAVLITVFFKEKITNSITLAGFMLVVYIPLSYVTDRAIYNWRQKKAAAPRS